MCKKIRLISLCYGLYLFISPILASDILSNTYNCRYQLEQYDNNDFLYTPLANFKIELLFKQGDFQEMEIKEKIIALSQTPYFIKVSAIVFQPSNTWFKDQSNFLLAFSLLKKVNNRFKVIDRVDTGTNAMSSPEKLAEFKQGHRKIFITLNNTEQLTKEQNDIKPDATELTLVNVKCNLSSMN